MKRRLVTAALASLLMSVITPMPADGQATSASEVKQRAEQLGHSHVDVWEVAGRHRVGFQNRRHRDEGRAVHELLESIDASPPRFSLTGRARGIDIYSVNLDDDAVSVVPAPAGSADSQPFLVDLVIHPFFGALLGSYSQPVRARTGIAPEIAVYPWKGGRISAQVEFVAVDDVSLNPKRIEPGLMSVSQWARIPVGRTYAAGGAGLFSSERYGLYADVQSLFLDGRIALHGSAAYTGFAALESKTWYVSSLNRVQALAGIEYVHPGLAASVLIRGGQFLDEDRGVRVDIRRAFGGFQIGFFGVSTSIDNTAGVSVRIPLLPTRQSAARARVVPARQLPIEYRYSADGGRILRTGYEIDLFANQLHPAVVEMQFRRARGGR
jgi:hypothetical protein